MGVAKKKLMAKIINEAIAAKGFDPLVEVVNEQERHLWDGFDPAKHTKIEHILNTLPKNSHRTLIKWFPGLDFHYTLTDDEKKLWKDKETIQKKARCKQTMFSKAIKDICKDEMKARLAARPTPTRASPTAPDVVQSQADTPVRQGHGINNIQQTVATILQQLLLPVKEEEGVGANVDVSMANAVSSPIKRGDDGLAALRGGRGGGELDYSDDSEDCNRLHPPLKKRRSNQEKDQEEEEGGANVAAVAMATAVSSPNANRGADLFAAVLRGGEEEETQPERQQPEWQQPEEPELGGVPLGLRGGDGTGRSEREEREEREERKRRGRIAFQHIHAASEWAYDLEDTRVAYHNLQDECERLETDKAALAASKKATEDNLEELEAKHEELKADFARLERKNKALQDQLNQANAKYNLKEQRVKKLEGFIEGQISGGRECLDSNDDSEE